MKYTLIALMLFASLVSSAPFMETSFQKIYYSNTFFVNGAINCNGNATCIADENLTTTCTIEHNNTVEKWSGTGRFDILVSTSRNGQEQMSLECTRSTTNIKQDYYVQTYQLDTWLLITYLVLLIAPWAILTYAIYHQMVNAKDTFLLKLAALAALLMKYVFIYALNYKMLFEIYTIDGFFGLAVVGMVFLQIVNSMANGDRKTKRNFS